MLPPNTSTNFRQGVYKPINRNKYKGSKDPVYRSGWELKFFKFCDGNPNVLEWTSEGIIIPYVSPVDNKVHRYFVDNMVYIKEGEVTKRYLIEIKPSKQTQPPTVSNSASLCFHKLAMSEIICGATFMPRITEIGL